MAAKLTIKGGPDLRARLLAIPAGAPEMVAVWADDAASRMRSSAPNARRPESQRFTPKTRGLRGAVYGAFWWVFVDRGRKKPPEGISGGGGKNPPTTLMFSIGGRTIFAKHSAGGRMRKRPFITKAAQDALASSKLVDLIIKQWNRKRLTGSHKAFL